jgi:hypothetical protein
MAIPYGIYDTQANRGAVFVGTSHDTPAFAVDAIAQWWLQEGCQRYPTARELFILADGGGSNGARCRAWRKALQDTLCTPLGLTVIVSHYPPGASQWNPIEHRLFSQISKELGWRAAHRYRQDPQIHRYHQNRIRPYRQRLPHPGELRHRNQDPRRRNASTQPLSPRNARSLELHHTPNSDCELVLGHRLRTAPPSKADYPEKLAEGSKGVLGPGGPCQIQAIFEPTDHEFTEIVAHRSAVFLYGVAEYQDLIFNRCNRTSWWLHYAPESKEYTYSDCDNCVG